jgi:hypothetical protein
MEDNEQGLGSNFWQALVIALIAAVVTFILFKRKHWWIKMIDAEEAFWERFGIPRNKGGLRAFAESRTFAISFAIITVILFIGVAVAFVLHLIVVHQRSLMTNP